MWRQSGHWQAVSPLDFNNILTVISGYVGLLQSQITPDNPKLLTKIQIGEAAEP